MWPLVQAKKQWGLADDDRYSRRTSLYGTVGAVLPKASGGTDPGTSGLQKVRNGPVTGSSGDRVRVGRIRDFPVPAGTGIDDRVELVREGGGRPVEAAVIALQYLSGSKAVAVRFLHGPCDWMNNR